MKKKKPVKFFVSSLNHLRVYAQSSSDGEHIDSQSVEALLLYEILKELQRKRLAKGGGRKR